MILMRTANKAHNPLLSHAILRAGVYAQLLFWAATFGAAQIPAKPTPATAAAPAPARKAFHSHRHRDKNKAQASAALAPPAPAAIPAPPPPLWPANEQPVPAVVTWDSHGLRIQAANSSLKQILNDVATVTGAKVEGLSLDERVYGTYGPGRARDVLSQLLQGSAYNILLVEDRGEESLREIVLSSRRTAFSAPVANHEVQAKSAKNNDDDDDDDDGADEKPIAPPRPVPEHRAFPPNAR
jgi:hypothetical protein